MIYQHRLVIAREGRLEKRHTAFQQEAMAKLDDYGSVLIGAWEIVIGPDACSGIYQMRQFDNITAWKTHQDRVRADRALTDRRRSNLYPYNDFVDTALIAIAPGMRPLPEKWPSFEDVRGKPRGYIEQRILTFRPDTAEAHHRFYRETMIPVLNREGSEFIGLFDTVIGPGTTNAGSHRSIELRRYSDLSNWQRRHRAQDDDPVLRKLIREDWMSKIVRMDSALLYPMDYSRIR